MVNIPPARRSTRSIGHRLLKAFAVVLVLALTGSGIGVWSLARVAAETDRMVNDSVATERLVSDWYRNTASSIRRTTAIAVSTDLSLADYFAAEAAESTKATNELQQKVEPLMSTPDEKAVYTEIGAARKEYLATRDAIAAAKKAGNIEQAHKDFEQRFVPASLRYQTSQKRLLDMQRSDIDAAAERVGSTNRLARIALIVFGLSAVGMGVALSLWLARSITGPIRRAEEATDRIASLDLTEVIDGHDRDETGRLLTSLGKMQAALGTLVGQVRTSVDSITTASTEIAVGNQDLSARTEQAAANLQQTAASVEQMTSTVSQSADSARTASSLASDAAAVAATGGEVVSQVVATMEDINQSSRRIADIIGVIDGIAFQTNILALNAAVEAARAGEQGRGFAVVASEVRSLAQRSAQAAREIKDLIGTSVEKVESGSKLVARAGQTMGGIVSSVQRVSQIIGEISAAATEQSQGITQVNVAVSNLDQMTQQNAALVEESAAAADSLKQQAQTLATSMQQFRLRRASGAPAAQK
jgi:methyl-accepting chemotaxis protein